MTTRLSTVRATDVVSAALCRSRYAGDAMHAGLVKDGVYETAA